MNPDLVAAYNQELSYLREQGKSFAEQHPRIASHLGLSAAECKDPHVERLLEGVAFLTAKLNLKLDAEFPTITQHLLAVVAPELLAPMPSITIVQMQPDWQDSALHKGYELPRDTVIRSAVPRGEQTACEFRSRAALTLWPIQLRSVDITQEVGRYRHAFSQHPLTADRGKDVRACLVFELETTPGVVWQDLSLDELVFYCDCQTPLLDRILSAWVDESSQLAYGYQQSNRFEYRPVFAASCQLAGFDDASALLPESAAMPSSYRLLKEYFSCPERFQFLLLQGLQSAVASVNTRRLQLVLGLTHYDPLLDQLRPDHFQLNCVPAINLFPKTCDRVIVKPTQNEHLLCVDRTRTQDFEIHSLCDVQGFTGNQAKPCQLLPYYSATTGLVTEDYSVYTYSRRVQSVRAQQAISDMQTGYIGTDIFLQCQDVMAEGRHDQLPFQQLEVAVLCSNRDLPMKLPRGSEGFCLLVNAPVEEVRCLLGPTKPMLPLALAPNHHTYSDQQRVFQDTAWQLIATLSQNYIGLRPAQTQTQKKHSYATERLQSTGLSQLKRLLSVFVLNKNHSLVVIESLVAFETHLINRVNKTIFPPCLLRGVEVVITFDEERLQGFSATTLGKLLSLVLAQFIELNAFVDLTLKSLQRGVHSTWPMSVGNRGVLT